MSKLIDITPSVRAGMAVFPGDAPCKVAQTFAIGPECPVNVTEISISTHCGAHADAPLHYDADGKAIDELDLDDFVGPARVIDARGNGPLCQPDEIAGQMEGVPARVLLRLQHCIDPMVWPAGFRTLAPETMQLLAESGVRLVGVDVPSVDPDTSKDLPSHQVARTRDLRILENLALSEVEPGDYELIALPMKLEGLDAAPVRAVLRPNRSFGES
ncbi:arylformamidase [Labrenzia sp. CE80]|uniref:arylformamidase n=1 Tax=Labrenzia sp. CE80 TaxID=1788986 RepID=UPI00129AADCA|nr:arylformamidase [Labrenzia sp. CE80]